MNVSVTGKVASYKGLTEIIPAPGGIDVTGEGATLPNPYLLTIEELKHAEIGEQYEGRLVKIKGFIETMPDSPAGEAATSR